MREMPGRGGLIQTTQLALTPSGLQFEDYDAA